MQENRISIQISKEDQAAIETAVKAIQEKLFPYLIALSADDRQRLPKMSDGTLPFVQKTLEYSVSDPEFMPAYIDVPELKTDVDASGTLLGFFRPVEQIYQLLDDTIMLCGSEAFVASLAYYQSVKHAARLKVPRAETIYRDLSQRFVKQSPKPGAGPDAPQQPK